MARPIDDDEQDEVPELDEVDEVEDEYDEGEEEDGEADEYDEVEGEYGEYEYEYEEDEDDVPESAPTSLVGRARGLISGPTPAQSPSTNPTSPKRQVDRLDDRERRLSYGAAGGAVVIGLIIYLAEENNAHFRLAKGQLTPQTTLVLGIVCGALLLVATRFGRRAPVGFVALFTFLFLGTRYFAGVPFLILAVWLLYRSYKFQKEATARAKEARSGRAAPPATTSRSADRSTKATRKPATTKGPSRPEANKRYTPKRPTAPPPKLSRRERKAAEASE